MRAICASMVCLALLSSLAWCEHNPADYPLTISILDQPAFTTHSFSGAYTYTASGHANAEDGGAIFAVDYSYDCNIRLVPNSPTSPYIAKWSKPNQKIRMKVLASVIGEPNKFVECEMKTTVRDGVYFREAGQAVLIPKAEYDNWQEERKERNSADYPMEITVIEENVSPSMTLTTPSGATQTRLQGSGRGNLYAGQDVHGVELSYSCGFPLYTKRKYAARWIVPQQQLEVLRTGAGQNFNGPNICVLTTTMKDVVYLTELGAGVTGTISPEEYARRNAAAGPTGAPAPAPGATVTPANQEANVTKVVIHSQPEGADIEVDGNYVGSTPSTLPMTPGRHKIVVRKLGFEDWERQMQFMGGETQVQADLEEKKAADSQ